MKISMWKTENLGDDLEKSVEKPVNPAEKNSELKDTSYDLYFVRSRRA